MHLRTGVLLAVLLSLLVSGCGGSPAARKDPDALLVRTAADRSACEDVQKVFLDLAALSGRWDTKGKPFDTRVARAFDPLGHELRMQARSASTRPLRVVIERNAVALGNLSAAMRSRRQVRVDAALVEARRAYAALPGCAHRDGKRSLPLRRPKVSGSGGASPSPAAEPDAVCPQVKRSYDRLSPVSAAWNLDKDPYDARTAAAFKTAADQLRAAADQAASGVVRQTLRTNAHAFATLAAAMKAHRRAGVRSGVIAMQQSAVDVAALCPLG